MKINDKQLKSCGRQGLVINVVEYLAPKYVLVYTHL